MTILHTLSDKINDMRDYFQFTSEMRKDSRMVAGKRSEKLKNALSNFKQQIWYDEVSDINLVDVLEFYKKPYRKKGMPEVIWDEYKIKMDYKEGYTNLFDDRYNDGKFTMHLCHKKGNDYAPLATIASNPEEKTLIVTQVQGVRDKPPERFVQNNLFPVYWTYALVTLMTDFAIKNDIPELRILPKDKSDWTMVKGNSRYYRQYDITALDLGFEGIFNGEIVDINFSETREINREVDYYILNTQQLSKDDSLLHPELLEMGIKVPNFDIKDIHRR